VYEEKTPLHLKVVVPSDKYGEEVEAAVVLKGGREGGKAVEEAILTHCHTKLAAYKCPRRLYAHRHGGKIHPVAARRHFLPEAADKIEKNSSFSLFHGFPIFLQSRRK
jgi:acyl-CoA synthetase (AMP-forming)/AMP-acid ligase II